MLHLIAGGKPIHPGGKTENGNAVQATG